MKKLILLSLVLAVAACDSPTEPDPVPACYLRTTTGKLMHIRGCVAGSNDTAITTAPPTP